MQTIKRTIKKLGIMFAAITLMSGSHTVLADEPSKKPDLDRLGSVTIVMKDGETDEPISGGTLTLFAVASVHECPNDTYEYRYYPEFADARLPLDNLNSAELADGLAEYAVSNHLIGETKPIGDDGKVHFFDLPTGIYLFIQNNAPFGFNPVRPFIIPIPIKEGNGYGWIYDIDAGPKVELVLDEEITPSPTPDLHETPSPGITTSPLPGETTLPADITPQPTMPPKLPQTGQLNWPVPVLTFCGLILFGIGYALSFIKKGNSNA